MASKIDHEKEQELFQYLLERTEELKGRSKKALYGKTSSLLARDKIFFEELELVLKSTFKNKLPIPAGIRKPKGSTNRILEVLISDTHTGSKLNKKEHLHVFGEDQFARRMARIAYEVANYKTQYRDNTKLYLHFLGDLIQGVIHEQWSAEPLAHQIASASYVFTQFVRYLSKEFPNGVEIFCTTGNHGRFPHKHTDRAISQRFDSAEMVIYKTMALATDNLPNVKFHTPLTAFYTFNAFDNMGYFCHGDTVLKPGYPNKSINIESLTKQINSINAAAGKKGKEYSVFAVGHVHSFSLSKLNNGAWMITNAALIPVDSYAHSLGNMEASNGQVLFESTPRYMVGDTRFIEVNFEDDENKSLDKIIKPFPGL